jgi:ankyrin repeat protein
MLLEHFLKLVQTGIANEVKQFLEDNPTFNVNEVLYGHGYTALHFACRDDHHEIVSVLLMHPQINVNQKNNKGSTPFLLGCLNGRVEVVKILLKDSRVNINMADDNGCTPLLYASYDGYVEVIKWMIALRGDDLDLDLDEKGKYIGIEYSAIEVARKENKTEVVSLLERFTANPSQARHEFRFELGLIDEDAAELFAMTVFLCDDFLRLKEPTTASYTVQTENANIICFFDMMSKLPMELQMVLCYRVFGSGKEIIKSKDSEIAFKSLARVFYLK